jgi:hypothetical protein
MTGTRQRNTRRTMRAFVAGTDERHPINSTHRSHPKIVRGALGTLLDKASGACVRIMQQHVDLKRKINC